MTDYSDRLKCLHDLCRYVLRKKTPVVLHPGVWAARDSTTAVSPPGLTFRTKPYVGIALQFLGVDVAIFLDEDDVEFNTSREGWEALFNTLLPYRDSGLPCSCNCILPVLVEDTPVVFLADYPHLHRPHLHIEASTEVLECEIVWRFWIERPECAYFPYGSAEILSDPSPLIDAVAHLLRESL